jgi:sugar lactone lactonase YvrE
VGSYKNSAGTTVSLADEWNSLQWQSQSPAPPGAKATELRGVSCTSSSACTAVGSYTNTSGAVVTLAERFKEGVWTFESTPNPNGAKESRLTGVSCTSASTCSAVGFYKTGSGSPFLSFAENWNVSKWEVQTTVNPLGATKVQLLGVSCSATGACTAVGTYTNSASETLSLAERLSGTEWKIQGTPPSGGKGAELSGVSCPSASACTAVGRYTNSSGNAVSLAEGWNGSNWTLQPMAGPAGALNTRAAGVSCTASSVCAAVGSYEHTAGHSSPLAELWNGSEWLPWPATTPSGAESGELLTVSCVSSYACEAAGSYTSSATQLPLAEGLGAPGAATGPAAGVTKTSAKLTGSVKPNAWMPTTYHFEYGQTTGYGTSIPVPDASLKSETTAEEVSQTIAFPLGPATTYHFRLVASNAAGTIYGRDQTFTTVAQQPPGVSTGPATKITTTNATLTATVTPNSAPTTYHFEYGPTTGYGTSIPVPDSSLKSETTAEEVSQTIAYPPGPAATYHFRLVASNAGGTTDGKDQTFTTVPVLPPSVSSVPATNVTATNATLTGTVTPNNWPTTYRFEYGLTSSYGASVPVPDASLKSETTAEEVSQTIVVAPGKTYHFRLVGRHTGEASAEVYGEDRTFTTPPAPAPSYTSSFGSLGTGGGQFNFPEGVAVDPKDNVWVTDHKNNRVEEFSSAGTFMMTFGWGVKNGNKEPQTCNSSESCQAGIPGSGEGQFRGTAGIAVEKSSGNLWVADWEGGRVEEFSSDGKYLTSIATRSPTLGVAVDPSDNVWVTNAGGGWVQEFSSSPLHPELRQFRMGWAAGVAADSQGNISVVNEGNHRVDESSPEANFIRTFGWGVQDGKAALETCTSGCQAGIPGSEPGQMHFPGGVAVDEKGILWVSDVVNNRVEEFTPTGEYITQFGSGGGGTEQFSNPWGIAVAGGAAYIGDRGNNRVDRWNVSE